MMLVKMLVEAMNSRTQIHEPMSCAFFDLGRFIRRSSLKRSDLASKYMKIIDRKEARGNAAAKRVTYPKVMIISR